MNPFKHWSRIIVHVDMDAFFASVEQRDFPDLRNKPVGVTNGLRGSCIITCSYEARAYGIKTGMRLKEAWQRCPHLIQRPSRPKIYAATSMAVMESLYLLTPDIEMFSVDEAFLDFTHCKGCYDSPQQIIHSIKEYVWDAAQVTCSVGMSGDKTTAKVASKMRKPNGHMMVWPAHAEQFLSPLPITKLCGIARGVSAFLAQYDVYKCGDIKNIPISILGRRYGQIGKRIWLMCQGKDPLGINPNIADPQSIGHGKVIPPNTKDKDKILFFLHHMAEKVALRLRNHQFKSKLFFVGIRAESGWIKRVYKTITPTHDGVIIYRLARELVEEKWQGEGIFQCQITALEPEPAVLQYDMLTQCDEARDEINQVMDSINQRFGSQTIKPAAILTPMEMPDVIAPAWRPGTARDSIT